MGGICCYPDILEKESTNVENSPEISSDWDEIESEIDDQINEDLEREDSHEFRNALKHSNNEDSHHAGGTLTDNIDGTSNVEEVVEASTVLEEPLKSLYSEEEIMAKKQRAFALDLKLYANTHKS